MLFTSNASDVWQGLTPDNLTTLRGRYSDMRLNAKRILVPVNGDPVSESTFRWACQTAREYKAELHAVYVIEVPLDLSMEAEITEDINTGKIFWPALKPSGPKRNAKTSRPSLCAPGTPDRQSSWRLKTATCI